MKLLALAISSLFAVSLSSAAQAGSTNAAKAQTASSKKTNANLGAPMSAAERKQLAAKIVSQWGAYVKEMYGTDSKVWAKAMAGTFASADPMNLRKASTRTTYEGMAATLLGRGQQTTDDEVIDTLAKSSSNAERLGDLAKDLVYTMITPCRIIDTRNAGGQLASGETRNFVGSNPGQNFSTQGGTNSTDCGIPADPAAVVMNVTVVTPTTGGYLTVFPAGETLPLAASINYETGDIKGNELIVKQTQLQATDFSIYTTTSTHVVADAVGYFIAPEATALDCSVTAGLAAIGTTGGAGIATCPAGTNVTGGSCTTLGQPGIEVLTSVGVPATSQSNGQWTCTFSNTGGVSTTAPITAMCCRVPGR